MRLRLIGVNQVFGYIRPHKSELLVREYEQYRGIYCTLCKQMGLTYGRISRLTLSYDCTFLAMVLMGLSEECPSFAKGRCVVNPLKSCVFCSGGQEAFRYAGAVSILLTDAKLLDDWQDSGFFGKCKAGFLRLLGRRSYRKAAKAYPEMAESVKRYLAAQQSAEKNTPGSLDACADPTAKLLAEVLKNCNSVLNMTVSHIIAPLNLLEWQRFGPIIENVIEKGLPEMQREILFLHAKEKKHV